MYCGTTSTSSYFTNACSSFHTAFANVIGYYGALYAKACEQLEHFVPKLRKTAHIDEAKTMNIEDDGRSQ